MRAAALRSGATAHRTASVIGNEVLVDHTSHWAPTTPRRRHVHAETGLTICSVCLPPPRHGQTRRPWRRRCRRPNIDLAPAQHMTLRCERQLAAAWDDGASLAVSWPLPRPTGPSRGPLAPPSALNPLPQPAGPTPGPLAPPLARWPLLQPVGTSPWPSVPSPWPPVPSPSPLATPPARWPLSWHYGPSLSPLATPLPLPLVH